MPMIDGEYITLGRQTPTTSTQRITSGTSDSSTASTQLDAESQAEADQTTTRTSFIDSYHAFDSRNKLHTHNSQKKQARWKAQNPSPSPVHARAKSASYPTVSTQNILARIGGLSRASATSSLSHFSWPSPPYIRSLE